ncbi:MAG TPA: hypothetical protein VGC97_08785 [Pyrinomonadaceae bacterium]|jgi:hypothetical protein
MPSIKCNQCNLVNFSTEINCKRCGNPLNEYAPIADQRSFQTSAEQSFQTQAYQPNAEQNYTQSYHQPNNYQNQQMQYHPQQMPPTPAFYGNQYEAPPMSCIKCGERREVYMQHFKKNYIPPVALLGAFFGLIPAVILIAVLQVEHQLQAPFCGVCWTKFKKTKTVETLTAVGGIFIFLAAIIIAVAANSFFIFLLFVAGCIALIVYGQMYKSKNSPKFKKVNRQEVVITDPLIGDVSFVR